MAKSNLNVHSQALSNSASSLKTAAEQVKQQANAAFGGGHHLAATFGRGAFASFINGVLGELETHLPQDIERLIQSYAVALLDLDRATTSTDQALAEKAKSDGRAP